MVICQLHNPLLKKQNNLNQTQVFFVLCCLIYFFIFIFFHYCFAVSFSSLTMQISLFLFFFRSLSEVIVSHVDSPTHFFIQYNQNGTQIEALGNKLNTLLQVRFSLTFSQNSWVFTGSSKFYVWSKHKLLFLYVCRFTQFNSLTFEMFDATLVSN